MVTVLTDNSRQPKLYHGLVPSGHSVRGADRATAPRLSEARHGVTHGPAPSGRSVDGMEAEPRLTGTDADKLPSISQIQEEGDAPLHRDVMRRANFALA